MKMNYRFSTLTREKIMREIGMMVALNTLIAIFVKLVFTLQAGLLHGVGVFHAHRFFPLMA